VTRFGSTSSHPELQSPANLPDPAAFALHRYTTCVDVRRILLVSISLILFAVRLPAAPPVIVCYGDSITAGYGLAEGQSFPDALDKLLHAAGYQYKIENKGTSGATTKDAVASLQTVLHLHPEVVIVEFGGNDGLRGLPLQQTRRNLDQVISVLQAAHVKVLLAGITLPPNYGPDYVHQFDQVFTTLAAEHHTAFVPMIYKNLIDVPGTIQRDGIHPTAKGSQIIAQTLLPVLKPLLHK
jgi:acyl-CoA thioesterase-1